VTATAKFKTDRHTERRYNVTATDECNRETDKAVVECDCDS